MIFDPRRSARSAYDPRLNREAVKRRQTMIAALREAHAFVENEIERRRLVFLQGDRFINDAERVSDVIKKALTKPRRKKNDK